MEDLLGQTKTRLAQTVKAQANLLAMLNRDLALAAWENEIQAGQIRRALAFVDRVETEPCVPCLGYVPRSVRKMLTDNPPEATDG